MNTNVQYFVTKTVEEDPVLRIGFERNLISSTKLAKHIVSLYPEHDLSQESVRTAVRRMRKEVYTKDQLSSARQIIANSTLHVRNNMVKIEFKKDESTLQLINKSFKFNEIYNNDLFRLIKGHSVLDAVMEEEALPKILELFNGKIESINRNLAEFIIVMPPESKQTPGVFLSLTNELSMNNINFEDAYSCGAEINIIVDEQDNQKAYNILYNLLKRCKATANSES